MRECQFCGFDEGWVKETSLKSPIKYKVVCSVCGACGPESFTREGAEQKWDGILSEMDPDTPEFKKMLKEDMGGVSSPMSTLVNTPGVGNAVPAGMAAMSGAQQYDSSAKGSGDKWGGGPTPKKKKKKKVIKHKIDTIEEYTSKLKKKGLTKKWN